MVWPIRKSGCGGPCWGSMGGVGGEAPRAGMISFPHGKVAARRGPCHHCAPMRPAVFCAVLTVLATSFPGAAARADSLPDIHSRSAAVIDADSGDEIFGKDADDIRPIASTTKIFVALAVRK